MSSKIEYPGKNFLPTSRHEMEELDWEQADIIIVSGDAYIDHPSFGSAILGRLGEKMGLKVAILPQPNWRDDLRDFKKLGKPRLFFGATAGNMDSMINHYTALKRLRSNDNYTPGGKAGFRPDYATSVYTKILKKIYPDTPVIIGGIEASMRRLTHYDYWSDSVKPSILSESGADMLIYGMAEQPFMQIIKLLNRGVPLSSLQNILQTSFLVKNKENLQTLKNTDNITLPSYELCKKSKKTFADAFKIIEESSNLATQPRLFQKTGESFVVVNPPYPVAKEKEIDEFYDLPFTRIPHPRYKSKSPIPAYEMIRHSVTLHRGCFGGCSFCTISAHQGKFIASRSEKSILAELEKITKMEDFKGHITDLGGPTANMYKMSGFNKTACIKCIRASCIFPDTCTNLNFDHNTLIKLYKKASLIEGIKKITIGSGIRYDMLVKKNKEQNKKFALNKYARLLINNHVSGRLKVAPEHISAKVLQLMRKPSFDYYKEFDNLFRKICKENNLRQELVPYFISGHPGSSENEIKKLNEVVADCKLDSRLVQEFTPTPMTLATTIYYTGIDPFTGKKIYTPKISHLKRKQKNYFMTS